MTSTLKTLRIYWLSCAVVDRFWERKHLFVWYSHDCEFTTEELCERSLYLGRTWNFVSPNLVIFLRKKHNAGDYLSIYSFIYLFTPEVFCPPTSLCICTYLSVVLTGQQLDLKILNYKQWAQKSHQCMIWMAQRIRHVDHVWVFRIFFGIFYPVGVFPAKESDPLLISEPPVRGRKEAFVQFNLCTMLMMLSGFLSKHHLPFAFSKARVNYHENVCILGAYSAFYENIFLLWQENGSPSFPGWTLPCKYCCRAFSQGWREPPVMYWLSSQWSNTL